MELARLTLPILDVNVDFLEDEGFGLDNAGVEYPPSSAHSFTSGSSSFGPYTPTSGRSTPRMSSSSMDFGSSLGSSSSSGFGPYTPTSERSTQADPDFIGLSSSTLSIDPFSFNLTPPSSALPTYFQVGGKSENIFETFHPHISGTPTRTQELPGPKLEDGFEMFQPHHPATPVRNQEPRGIPSSPYGVQVTPSQPISFYSFPTELGPSPFPPNTMQSTQSDQNWDTSSIWAQPSSPVSFDKRKGGFQLLAGIEEESGQPLAFVPGSTGRKLLFRAREEMTIMGSPLVARKRARGSRNANTVITQDGLQISKVPPRKFKCSYEGCTKQYERKEHLKRHVQSNHLGAKHKCQYCEKTFNRTDNRRYHLQLHAKERKAGRVEYMAGAEQSLEEEMKRSKRRRSAR